ncbi:acetyltransferase [Azorhizobium oxalatiphilum]|uniref:Acetyltransferase n=1 Tax=Azorhizobium oxalatiphilum TaxID=980631 RepID=A0A917CDX6_9HYPH|nr:GNAT family N-acetyltransferase [Azorhizobium oxalatiphilum]GGF81804.1 acetyltransferase [Azorhizobium oxalatiphilum]
MADIIRTLDAAEVELALTWGAREGWNTGLHDAAAFRAQDTGAFLGLFRDGALAACISVTTYGEDFGFLGFYICRPDLRGQGLGWRLWQAGMERLGTRTVGLDGVVAQQENYKKSGFALAHRNIRYGGVAQVPAPAAHLAPVASDLVPALIAYDADVFGVPRPDFLAHWLAPPDGLALAVRGPDGTPAGYGVIRRARVGWKIGPLFADTPEVARSLFAGLVAHAGGADVFLDVPAPNAVAVQMAEAAGLSPVFETARMYKGDAPALPLARIYGITTFELG